MKTMKAKPEWLRAQSSGRPVSVDRKNRVLRGYVVAQLGPFKSEGRGEFDKTALQTIAKLGNEARGGLKSRFTHPTMSEDGLGKFLGRSQEFTLSKTTNAAGELVDAVRADLHFDPTASATPHGDLAKYVMDLAESDAEAISSSLVLESDYEQRLEKDGTAKKDSAGNELPPLWRPTRLHASDIVETGDAVDGLLSAPELAQALSVGLTPELAKVLRFDNVARLGSQMLDGLFAGQDRGTVEARCRAWLERYLSHRFGAPIATPALDLRREKLAKLSELVKVS